MRSIIRHLAPLCRSRNRGSFILIISLFVCIAFILFNIKSNKTQSIDHLFNKNSSLAVKNKQNIILNALNSKTKEGLPTLDENGRSLKTKFLVYDQTGFFGSVASEDTQILCLSSNTTYTWTRQQSRFHEVDFTVSHDAGGGGNHNLWQMMNIRGGHGLISTQIKLNEDKQQYSMAFIMESEVHSSTGDNWKNYNFIMSYNLEDSYPEPVTYFNTNFYIVDLLKPPKVPFEEKEKQADIVWIISNCNAHNGREGFIQRLMEEIKIDSYGSCLNNRQGYGARMSDNIHAYIKYKFVVAIENSNCADYVTEKLVKAVESGSIPIVAGRNGRPDYRRYMPEHSYINIYDYTSIKALADDLKRIANNKTLYESYLWYKKHDKDIKKIEKLSLDEKIKHLTDVIGANATMITHGIIAKEKSEDKICKLIRFVRQTSWQDIAAHERRVRSGPSIACLPHRGILAHFDSISSNSSQTIKS